MKIKLYMYINGICNELSNLYAIYANKIFHWNFIFSKDNKIFQWNFIFSKDDKIFHWNYTGIFSPLEFHWDSRDIGKKIQWNPSEFFFIHWSPTGIFFPTGIPLNSTGIPLECPNPKYIFSRVIFS